MIYEIIEEDSKVLCVKKTEADGRVLLIPLDESNSDYQRYLRWLENPDAEEAQSL